MYYRLFLDIINFTFENSKIKLYNHEKNQYHGDCGPGGAFANIL